MKSFVSQAVFSNMPMAIMKNVRKRALPKPMFESSSSSLVCMTRLLSADLNIVLFIG